MLFLALVTLVTFGWALRARLRGERAVAVAAGTMGLVCASAWLASTVELQAWLDGGYGMHLLTLIGGYTAGAAAGAFSSGRPRARLAAMVGIVVLALSGVAFFRQAMGTVEDLVRNAPIEEATFITTAARAEAMRLIQYASVLGIIAAALLLMPRRRRALPTLSPSPSRAAV